MPRPAAVDDDIRAHPDRAEILTRLREILNATAIDETIKRRAPCDTAGGKNIVGIVAFKEHTSLWFHQGAPLSDPEGVLTNAQEGKTKAMRHWRINSKKDIKARAIKADVKEAIEHQQAGRANKPERNTPIEIPGALAPDLKTDRKLRTAFEALTPGRRREYAIYVAETKRETTRLGRVEKTTPIVLDGKGLYDIYKNC